MSHPSYDVPQRIRYQSNGIIQFGATGETVSMGTFRGPVGKRGLVRDIEINITETMVGTTTVPEVNVGSAISALGAVLAEYARFRLGTSAIAGYATSTPNRRARSLTTGNPTPPVATDFTAHVQLETATIPADTNFVISLLEGAGGAPAGAGIVAVEIEWF